MHDFGVTERDLAEFAVLLRRHAALHPGAQFRDPITVDEVLASRPIASPLKMLDCCPVSDGGAAYVISRDKGPRPARIRGAAQAHLFQHISAAPSLTDVGAGLASQRAMKAAGISHGDVKYLGIYDSFTITLTMLLEEIGFAARGEAGVMARDGVFNREGALPLNTHGGLISYGHCGVGGAMAHLVETHRQLTGRADERQVKDASLAFLHGDGGVLSSHVSLVMEAC
jgi:acetyl-CoA acetyltransferase